MTTEKIPKQVKDTLCQGCQESKWNHRGSRHVGMDTLTEWSCPCRPDKPQRMTWSYRGAPVY